MRTPAPLPPTPPPQTMESNTHLLEIDLISAQNLKPPSTNLRRKFQTYAVAYVDPALKLRTRIDRVGSENPTWNDKFIFRVTSDFLSSDTSAVTVDIFAVGVLKDALLGSVRFLLSNILSQSNEVGVPAFIAVQIRRPSGKFHGVLNVGAMVIDGDGIGYLNGMSAIGYRDFTGESGKRNNNNNRRHRRGWSDWSSGSESWGGDSVDLSDGTESTGSNSSASSSVLKEVNGRRDLAGDGDVCEGRILCGLGFQRKVHLCPSDQDLKCFGALDLKSTAQI